MAGKRPLKTRSRAERVSSARKYQAQAKAVSA